jgi:hypothetical protein
MGLLTIIIAVSCPSRRCRRYNRVCKKYCLKAGCASIISEAEKEGEVIKKDKMLQAKERFLQLKIRA